MEINFNVIYLPENQGHGNARRVSLEQCTNELVALMDADDISLPNRFEKQIQMFQKDKTLDIVGGQITEFIGEPTNIIGKRMVPESDIEIKKYIKKRCPMNQVSVMFKKSFYNQVGGYIDWYCEEDYFLWIRMFEHGGMFANLPDTLVNVRVGNAMSARRGGWKYFFSEAKLQKYMLDKKIISIFRYLYNIAIRFCGEIILTNKLRTIVYKILRENNETVNNLHSVDVKEKYDKKDYFSFSVAMCVYGGDNPEHFDEALRSIVEQSLKPDEIVLVVDGAIPDEIQLVIDKYDKNRYKE